MDLQNPKWMYLKAALFVGIGVLCFGFVWLDSPKLSTAAFMLLMIWAFARAYYFAFYVIEKYIDPTFRFAGLVDFVRYMVHRRGSGRA
jgi:hypothetical protein